MNNLTSIPSYLQLNMLSGLNPGISSSFSSQDSGDTSANSLFEQLLLSSLSDNTLNNNSGPGSSNPLDSLLSGGSSNPLDSLLSGSSSNPLESLLSGSSSNPLDSLLSGSSSNPLDSLVSGSSSNPLDSLLSGSSSNSLDSLLSGSSSNPLDSLLSGSSSNSLESLLSGSSMNPADSPNASVTPEDMLMNKISASPVPFTSPLTTSVQQKSQFNSIIQNAATAYGVDPQLIQSVIQHESGGNPLSTSNSGAQGLMQLMPDTARSMGVTNSYDPQQNIMAGTKYLKQLLNQFDGNKVLAVAAYNAGPGSVEKYNGVPPYKETMNYVQNVLTTAYA